MTNELPIQEQLQAIKDLCKRIRDERLVAGLSLENAEDKTKISKRYLVAIENGKIDDLPFSNIYKRHFIKNYAQCLGIKIDPEILQCWNSDKKNFCNTKQQKKFWSDGFDLPKFMRIIFVSIIIISFFGYLTYQVQNILQPPQLVIFSPENGQIIYEKKMEVNGKTNPEVSVFINSVKANSNEKGEFLEQVNLINGLNTIVISAKKKYGKTTTETRYVILKENQQFSLDTSHSDFGI